MSGSFLSFSFGFTLLFLSTFPTTGFEASRICPICHLISGTIISTIITTDLLGLRNV